VSAVQWRVGCVLRHAWSRCARLRLAAVFQATTTNFTESTDSVDACQLFSVSSSRSSPPAPTSPSVLTIPFEIHSRECASGFVQTALSKLPWRSRSLQTRRLTRQDSPDKVKAFIGSNLPDATSATPRRSNFRLAQDYRPMLIEESSSTHYAHPFSFRSKLPHLGPSAVRLRQSELPCGFGLDFQQAW
jgi:hypothetical protein